MGSDTPKQYPKELERTYFAHREIDVTRWHISESEVAIGKEVVRSAHSTYDYADRKTAYREGAQLYSCFQWR